MESDMLLPPSERQRPSSNFEAPYKVRLLDKEFEFTEEFRELCQAMDQNNDNWVNFYELDHFFAS